MKTVTIDGMPVGDGHPPRVMSVLNMSEQSGYKPSVYLDAEKAAQHIDEELVPAGADIIDIGLQSANPKYKAKAIEKELDRLEDVAPILDYVESNVPFSLETRYAEVAEEAIGHGFDIINDVCGFADPEMKPTVEAHDVPVIKMASPSDLTKPGALKTIDDVFAALERDGFTDRTIIDPAFGGWYDKKTFEDNWEMFRRLREFRAFGRPILTATNREDFLGALAGKLDTDKQLAVSLAAATMEVERGAHIIRTHDTPETHDVVKVAHALGDNRVTQPDSPAVIELTNVSQRELARYRSRGVETATSNDTGPMLTFVIGDINEELQTRLCTVAREQSITAIEQDAGLYILGIPQKIKNYATAIEKELSTASKIANRMHEAANR